MKSFGNNLSHHYYCKLFNWRWFFLYFFFAIRSHWPCNCCAHCDLSVSGVIALALTHNHLWKIIIGSVKMWSKTEEWTWKLMRNDLHWIKIEERKKQNQIEQHIPINSILLHSMNSELIIMMTNDGTMMTTTTNMYVVALSLFRLDPWINMDILFCLFFFCFVAWAI